MNRAFWVGSVFAMAAAACGSTIDVGQNDGGPNAKGGGGDAGASGDGSPGNTLSDAATSSSYFAKCKIACTPTERPCLTQDVNACIETCTAFTDGLSVGCAQCITENSGYSGLSCVPTCPKCGTCGFSPGPVTDCSSTSCVSGMPCPDCMPSDESCSGFKLAKTTDSACASLCK